MRTVIKKVLVCDIHGDEDNTVRTRPYMLEGRFREAELCEKALSEPLAVLMTVGRALRGTSPIRVRRAAPSPVTAPPAPKPIEAAPPPPIAPVAPPVPDQAVRANGAPPAATFSAANGKSQTADDLAYSPDVRKWAKEEGIKVGANGRIKRETVERYIAAHA